MSRPSTKKRIWYRSVVAAIFVIAAGLVLAGLLGPHTFHASVSGRINRSRLEVWALINRVSDIPARRPDVERVEHLPVDARGLPAWKEWSGGAATTFQMQDATPGQRVIVRSRNDADGTTATWTYVIAAVDPDWCTLTIEEDSRIDRLGARLAAMVMGRRAVLRRELDSLRQAAENAPAPASP